MKIVFSLHHFVPEVIAGTEIYVFNLAKELQRRGLEILVIIPGFEKESNLEFVYKGIRVIQYAENSIEDRQMILGNVQPKGIKLFTETLENERPDLVHFHELIAGRGPSIYHVEAVYKLKIKIVLTAHLSYYSCQTGTLMRNAKHQCGGKIDISRCSLCVYKTKRIKGVKLTVLNAGAKLLHGIGINSLAWNSSLGTALGVPYLIEKKSNDLARLSQMCDRIVSLADFYTQILLQNNVPAKKVVTIKQGLPGENIYVQKNAARTSKSLRLVFIGRISKFKGVHILLEALKQLHNDDYQLDIFGQIGEDAYTQHCKKFAEVMPAVKWKGIISEEEKYSQLSIYDLLVLPSTFSEMSPLVIQEAFAAGVPVLASDVYGNAEQITDGLNGWLFEFDNADDLAKEIKQLIANPQLITAAKRNLPPVRSFASVAIEYEALYNSMYLHNESL